MDINIDSEKVAQKLTEAGAPGVMIEQLTDEVLDILQTSVAMRLEDELSDEQLLEFENLAKSSDPTQGSEWIRNHFPNYDQIVDEELNSIITDLVKTVENMKKNAS